MFKSITNNNGISLVENQKVGVVTNFFSEQLFSRDFEVIKISPENCLEEIEDNKIEVVFLEKTIYEEDHKWYGNNFQEILDFISTLNVNIVIINHDEDFTSNTNGKYFQININEKISEFSLNDNILNIPLLVNEKLFNPIDDKPTLDVVFFKWGELTGDEKIKKYPVKPKPKSLHIETNKITRQFIKDLVSKIKLAKVLYIYYSDEISYSLLKYIEVIATLQHTIVILDSKFEKFEGYAINTFNEDSNINYLQAYSRAGFLYDKKILSKSRHAFLNYTLVQRPPLYNILQGKFDKKDINIGVITSTMRKWTINDWVERLNNQKYVNVKAVLLTHGFELTEDEQFEIIQKANFELKIITQFSSVTLGACLNECIKYVDSDYITKIDDDDFYYPNYLIDSWIAKKYSQAKIVGKNSQFVYLEGSNLTIQRFIPQKHRFTTYIAGGTIFCETDFLRKYMFSDIPRAVDTDLFRRVLDDGGKIFSGHPYEFCLYRSSDTTDHTWQASETYVIRSSKVCFYSDPRESLTIN